MESRRHGAQLGTAGLLDTYETERHPVAERVVVFTQAQSALIGPGDEITGLRELFAELLRKPEVLGTLRR